MQVDVNQAPAPQETVQAPKAAARNAVTATEVELLTASTYTRLAAAMRLVACLVAMHMTFFLDVGKEALTVIGSLRVMLVLTFALYAVVLYWRTVRNRTHVERRMVYWLDCLFYFAITFATGGPASHFYFFLAFPLLFTSLRWGFRSGIVMTVFSCLVLLVTNISFWRSTGGAILSTNVLLGPSVLLALGYVMATWANVDLTLNRRLAALRNAGTLFNPRYSMEQAIDRVVRYVAEIYPLGKYVLLLKNGVAPPRVFRADLPQEMYRISDTAAAELATAMAPLSTNDSVMYVGKRGLLAANVYTMNQIFSSSANQLGAAEALAKRLDCVSFCAVNLTLRLGGSGHLIMWAEGQYFSVSDLPFFSQLADQIAPRIENVQLIDRLSAQAAESEREKISRDVHDSAIQPYIGLKFALEGLARKVAPDSPLAADAARLVDMANNEIQHMRTFIKGLRGDEQPGRAALVPALRRQAARFAELYGISVDVDAPDDLRIGDALANEVFHMVSAALANVRRHTTATLAHIRLAADHDSFTLIVTNAHDASAPVKLFTPRSIAERAQALGGTCEVTIDRKGTTAVSVRVPL